MRINNADIEDLSPVSLLILGELTTELRSDRTRGREAGRESLEPFHQNQILVTKVPPRDELSTTWSGLVIKRSNTVEATNGKRSTDYASLSNGGSDVQGGEGHGGMQVKRVVK